ncbi:MAG: VCBS repeat-containing protein [Planctomycetia bacterium]|nr:VCBS repeat-containing protein [Planctomycetia bacterium]
MSDRAILRRVQLAAVVAVGVLVFAFPKPAQGYVEVPMTLGDMVRQSTHVCVMQVSKVDREKNLIIYTKVQDIKGKHPTNEIKHNIGRGGLRPGEWQEIMNWAEVGKTAVFFHNGGASETFFGTSWYQAYPQGEWWGMSHGEPFLLRTYAGKAEKLGAIVTDMIEGKEVIVPCMVDGDKEALHKKTARIQRMKASLKIIDYNPKRDFVGWGGEDIRRLAGMAGFDKYAALAKLDAEAQSVTTVDFDNDGKSDICLCGANKVVLMQNGGDGFIETSLPGLIGGARSAVWADHNSDGLPDLLLATPNGPRLFTNLGKGQFKDDTKRLPKELAYNLTAAAWGDFNRDGKPDILLANGFHGLRVYTNSRPATQKIVMPKVGEWHAIGIFRAANPADNFKTEFAVEKEPFSPQKEYKGKRNMPTKWAKKEFKNQPVQIPEVGQNCATYVHTILDMSAAAELPVVIGNGGNTLTVWVNGEKIHSAEKRKPEPTPLVLKLKQGKNTLLVKMCNTDQPQAFSFAIGHGAGPPGAWFEDISTAWGFGPDGLASDAKGDTLAVADFTGDGKPDVLYGAGTGMLFINSNGKFVPKADSGISYKPGKVGPAVCDFDNDGHLDLFVPQVDGKCKLYRNDGSAKFTEVTASSGALANAIPGAVSAAWGDFDNDGKPDLLVCCLRGSNRYFKNEGSGKFTDKTSDIGLTQKVFNSQAASFSDLNGDGQLDLVLNNEGQESSVLFGVVKTGTKTPVMVALNGTSGLNGGKVVVKNAAGQRVACNAITGGDCRGGQCGLAPRFALDPGAYKFEIIGSDGKVTVKDVTVTTAPMQVKAN